MIAFLNVPIKLSYVGAVSGAFHSCRCFVLFDCRYNTLAREPSEIGQFIIDSADKLDLVYVCSQSQLYKVAGVGTSGTVLVLVQRR